MFAFSSLFCVKISILPPPITNPLHFQERAALCDLDPAASEPVSRCKHAKLDSGNLTELTFVLANSAKCSWTAVVVVFSLRHTTTTKSTSWPFSGRWLVVVTFRPAAAAAAYWSGSGGWLTAAAQFRFVRFRVGSAIHPPRCWVNAAADCCCCGPTPYRKGESKRSTGLSSSRKHD